MRPRFLLARTREAIVPRVAFALGLVLLVWAHLHVGGILHQHRNAEDSDIPRSDQAHNMKLAHWAWERRASEEAGLLDRLPGYSDGVVAPLWPWMASFLDSAPAAEEAKSTDQPMSDARRGLFHEGRRLHLVWTALFVVGLGVGLTALVTLPVALSTTAAASLVALLPRTAYFQPEPLLYALFLLAWLFALRALARQRLLDFALAGVLAGLAYLAKSSVLPFAGLFVVVGLLFALPSRRDPDNRPLSRLAGLLLFAGCFLLPATPRLLHAEKQFDDPFHSYPGYWMWMDDFEEAFEWMTKHPDGDAIAAAETIPSLGSYLEEHRITGFFGRLGSGLGEIVGRFLCPKRTLRGKDPPKPWKGIVEHRGIPLYVGAAALLVLALGSRPHLSRRHLELGLLVTGTFVLFACAFGFYVPISGSGDDRFLLMLYAPLFLALYWGGDVLVRKREHYQLSAAWAGLHLVMLAFAAWRIIEIVRHPVFEN